MTRIYQKQHIKRKLRETLIGAGVEGISQYNLTQKCRTKNHSIEDINEILHQWLTLNYVQKFIVNASHSKRPVTIWRATQLIVPVRF